jgi:hypothetical protein
VEQDETSPSARRDYIAEIFALCSTLSDEALASAETKATANGFDLDRAEISFKEIQINFVAGRDVIENAIREQKLIQLPITVQKRLLSSLEAISKALQGFMADTDQTVNFENAVESLNASIWQYGLNHLSDQILGYQKKINQLKQQEVRIAALLGLLEAGKSDAEAIDRLREGAQSDKEAIELAKNSSEEDVAAISVAKTKSAEGAESIQGHLAATSNFKVKAEEASVEAQAAADAISPLRSEIKAFFDEIITYREEIDGALSKARKFIESSDQKIAEMIDEQDKKIAAEFSALSSKIATSEEEHAETLSAQLQANTTEVEALVAAFTKAETARIKAAQAESTAMVETEAARHKDLVEAVETKIAQVETELTAQTEESLRNSRTEVATLVAELEELKERVKEQVAHATGVGQFGAFNTRQKDIAKTKYFWVGGIAILVAVVVALTYIIARDAGQSDLHSAAFWIKLSMNVPLGFLISFCAIQYNRERRLEEEYAFKASISISLTPYRDLIYQILEKDDAIKDGSYTTFVIDSVRNIFSSPTERIFDSPKRFEGVSEKSLKATAELIGTAVKAAK